MQMDKMDFNKFQRGTAGNSLSSSSRSAGQEHCRKKLKDKFDNCQKTENEENEDEASAVVAERTVLSVLNLSDTRKYIRNGAERISKTFNSMRTTFGSLSQRFKITTKRRQILQEGPMTPNTETPYTKSKQVLGRTPTKLYSPFGIDSPYHPTTTVNKENLPMHKMF